MGVAAKVFFPGSKDFTGDRYEPKNCLEGYLGMLARFGYAREDHILAWESDGLSAYVELSRAEATSAEHQRPTVLQLLQRLTEQVGEPEWTLLEPLGEAQPDWQEADLLYLFTGSRFPVWCGPSQDWVPSYLLPRDDLWLDELDSWAKTASLLDDLWLESGPLERTAYREIACHDSDLSIRGRGLAEELEEAAGKPVYYYLPRRYGPRPGEPKPLCPSCGRVFEQSPFPDSDYLALWCVACRLLSERPHTGYDASADEWAAIGAWRDGRD